jgi:hypothetical protein
MKTAAVLLLVSFLASGTNSGSIDFSWLIGCWETPDKSALEVWVARGDDSLSGFSVSILGDAVGFYEVLSIDKSRDNTWIFTAYPAGQEAAIFRAVTIGAASVVFANPDHDYPQEIHYSRQGKQLFASISLHDGKDARSFDKITCTE